MLRSLLANMIYVLIDVYLEKPLFISSAEVDSQLCMPLSTRTQKVIKRFE